MSSFSSSASSITACKYFAKQYFISAFVGSICIALLNKSDIVNLFPLISIFSSSSKNFSQLSKYLHSYGLICNIFTIKSCLVIFIPDNKTIESMPNLFIISSNIA